MNAVMCLTKQVKGTVGLSTTEKSSYYRSILIILHSIVEGLVYEIVKKNTLSPDHIFERTVRYGEVCKIKSMVLGTASDVHLYRRQKVGLGVNDDGATFARLNLFLKHKRIVNKRQYNSLNWVRTERNKLHIQGLGNSDINYTEAKVRRVGKTITFLMSKV